MQENNINFYKDKAISSIISLTQRTFLLQIISFVGTLLLTIFLTPNIFGIYYIVSAIVSFLGYFSDIGLGAALIQKKDNVTSKELSTVFILQQSLIGVLCLAALFASGYVSKFYNFDSSAVFLYRAVVAAFFISSLKTIPSILLERELNFKILIIPQIFENLVFYVIAVLLAYLGFGIDSFSWAVLSRGIIGLIIIYILKPWKFNFSFDKKSVYKLVSFGFPYQLNSILALIKDDLLTIVLGRLLTPTEIGYIGWAKKWSEFPLRLVMDSVVRVTFPAFSRVQSNIELLKKALIKTTIGISLFLIPVSIIAISSLSPLTKIIPKYEKWNDALFQFYLFSLVSLVASYSTPMTNLLMAIGKVKVALNLMILWTVSTWFFVLLLINTFGFNGVAMGHLMVSISICIVIYYVRKLTGFNLIKTIYPYILSGLLMYISMSIIQRFLSNSIFTLVFNGIIGISLFIVFVYVSRKNEILDLLKEVKIVKI